MSTSRPYGHPDALAVGEPMIEWCERNGLDPFAIPEGQLEVRLEQGILVAVYREVIEDVDPPRLGPPLRRTVDTYPPRWRDVQIGERFSGAIIDAARLDRHPATARDWYWIEEHLVPRITPEGVILDPDGTLLGARPMSDLPGVRSTFKLHRDAAGVSRRARATGPSCGPVSSVRVDPRVWSVAMDLCGGDPLRLEVISSTEVVVHNRGR